MGEGGEQTESLEGCVLFEGVSHRWWRANGREELLQVMAPCMIREALVLCAGEGPTTEHLGTREIVARLRAHCCWRRMSRAVAATWVCCYTSPVVGQLYQTSPEALLTPLLMTLRV